MRSLRGWKCRWPGCPRSRAAKLTPPIADALCERLHGSRIRAVRHTIGAGQGHIRTLVLLWYHVVMAMNLRLDEEDSSLLRALAEAEHVSMHEAVLRAIRRSAREVAHTERVREATAEMVGRWGEVLDRLGRV